MIHHVQHRVFSGGSSTFGYWTLLMIRAGNSPPIGESLVRVGYADIGAGRRPAAVWQDEEGRTRKRRFDTVEECEAYLRTVEGCAYVPPEERRRGRPAGVRGHRSSRAEYEKGCRAPGCVEAYRRYREDQRERLAQDLSRYDHPSTTAYKLGCRCAPCSAAALVRSETRTARRKAAIREQMAGLWLTEDVAEYLGVKLETVQSYRQKGKMPPPDMSIGYVHGWQVTTIRTWRPKTD